jgi:hypothetical protein
MVWLKLRRQFLEVFLFIARRATAFWTKKKSGWFSGLPISPPWKKTPRKRSQILTRFSRRADVLGRTLEAPDSNLFAGVLFYYWKKENALLLPSL